MPKTMVTLTHGDTMIQSPDAELVRQVFLGLIDKPAASTAVSDAPAIGEYWYGQGGIYVGKVFGRDGQPDYHLIFAEHDLGKKEWGGYNKESKATSKWDGLANTKALLESDVSHPAAAAAAGYSTDEHHDFYLPSAAELYQGWVNVPDLFAKEYHWSSSQRSAYYAYLMVFGAGVQSTSGKGLELSVRPVRRFIR